MITRIAANTPRALLPTDDPKCGPSRGDHLADARRAPLRAPHDLAVEFTAQADGGTEPPAHRLVISRSGIGNTQRRERTASESVAHDAPRRSRPSKNPYRITSTLASSRTPESLDRSLAGARSLGARASAGGMSGRAQQ